MTIDKLVNNLKSFWSSSSNATKLGIKLGLSFSSLIILRIILLRLRRRIKKLPNGPLGVPVLGSVFAMMSYGMVDYYQYVLPSYGKVSMHSFGASEEVLINDVSLAQSIFVKGKNKQATNVHVFDTGYEWNKNTKTRNQFGMSHKSVASLRSLLNNQELSKKHIKMGIEKNLNNMVFPTIDQSIANNESIRVGSLLRPMSFGLVSYALFGVKFVHFILFCSFYY